MRKPTRNTILFALIAVALIAYVGWREYVNHYYHADDQALAALVNTADDGITITQPGNSYIIFAPDEADSSSTGIVFYPGGKVEGTAYAPLMRAIAQRGVTCIIAQMPDNIAFFGSDNAIGARAERSAIQHWYMCGHSLGGVVAADHLDRHAADYEGIILLAAYSTADLTDTNARALSIYGTNDGVLNRDELAKNAAHLPADAQTRTIDGGNHAYFGSYGEQDGDGTATITPEQQWAQTADEIVAFVR